MSRMDLAWMRSELHGHDFQPLFATLSGAHLYGFESPDSDVDLRGAFVLPLDQVVGLIGSSETVVRQYHTARTDALSPVEMDLVCHDIHKYCQLIVKRSGEVLEQLYSPLVVWDSPALHELRDLAKPHILRQCYHHYRGFLGNQLRFVDKPEATVRECLYAYRVALTGIHLLKTGRVEANLTHLLPDYPQAGVDELLHRKRNQREKTPLPPDLKSRHRERLAELETELAQAFESSPLPAEHPDLRPMHDFVVRVRLGQL
jgi:uncharacterized protein